jgi:hypothetical protein
VNHPSILIARDLKVAMAGAFPGAARSQGERAYSCRLRGIPFSATWYSMSPPRHSSDHDAPASRLPAAVFVVVIAVIALATSFWLDDDVDPAEEPTQIERPTAG